MRPSPLRTLVTTQADGVVAAGAEAATDLVGAPAERWLQAPRARKLRRPEAPADQKVETPQGITHAQVRQSSRGPARAGVATYGTPCSQFYTSVYVSGAGCFRSLSRENKESLMHPWEAKTRSGSRLGKSLQSLPREMRMQARSPPHIFVHCRHRRYRRRRRRCHQPCRPCGTPTRLCTRLLRDS